MEDQILKNSCACLHVRRADRQLSQMYDAYIRPAGIRSTQFAMLKCVAALPDPFISDIGRVLNMDQTTVTRNIEKLEKAGLVATRPHPDDPRKKQVALSTLGEEKIAEVGPLWKAAQQRIVSHMGEEDFDCLLRLLNKLMQGTRE